MENFEYASPRTVEAAVELLNSEAAVLAGGTDLISLMKDHVVSPKRIVDIKGIRDLRGIVVDSDGSLRMGALVTLTELVGNKTVRTEYPSLAQAAAGVRSPQIQNVGTVGGDLCQRPRCWYYRSGFGLLAMKDGESMVRKGDNRYHAILGNSGAACFVNPSSLAPALIALEATVTIIGPDGKRDVPVEEFFRIPENEGEKEYVLGAGEIISGIAVPAGTGKNSATYEIRQREALDWPLTAAAAALKMGNGKVTGARVVLGHVAPVPWHSKSAAEALLGKELSAEVADAAGLAAVEGATPLSGNEYKVQLSHVAVKRAILAAAGMEVS